MEAIIIDILATNNKPVRVGKVHQITRDVPESDICHATFLGASGKAEYYLKFDILTKEIITFHKNIRKKPRDDRKYIKEQFWKKWNPAQFCTFQDEEKLKFELLGDLDLVINNHKGKLDEIDWGRVMSINKGIFERTP